MNLDSSVELLKLLEKHIDTLYAFLLSCGITPKDKQLSTLTEALKDVKALKPKLTYIAYETDANGYVVNAAPMATFTDVKSVPKDIKRGYYRVDKQGNLVVDNKRKAVLWGD
jgi:hypothetical protein